MGDLVADAAEDGELLVLAAAGVGGIVEAPVVAVHLPGENRADSSEIPKPAPGQMLLRTEFLSLDPYIRGRMSDAPSYAPPVEIGAVMVGGTVAQVGESELDGFAAGDWVLSFNGWQDYALSEGQAEIHKSGRNCAVPTTRKPKFRGYPWSASFKLAPSKHTFR